MLEMNTHPPSNFAAVDTLLDEALQLQGDAQKIFLDGLDASLRVQVIALLQRVDSTQVDDIASAAQRYVTADESLSAIDAVASAGRWQLKQTLGSGGMGQVFYAVRDEDDYAQRAAVKILWSHRADSDFEARFYRERRILASLDHPGVARFLDGGLLADGRPWFAMEYVDGIDVATFAENLPLAKRLELLLAICEPLQFAHERLVVHRDIKPHNILVDGSGRPRLLDFGIATITSELNDGVHTRTGGSLLTLQFASPEQVSGGLVTVGSDVYQLGLLTYQILTERLPYQVANKSLQETLQLICEEPVQAPSTHRRNLSQDLDAIVLCALRKDPAERYRSVAEFANDIRKYLGGRPVDARPHSRWYLSKRFLQRNALTMSLLATVAIALAAATTISIKMAGEARAEAQRSQKTQQILANVFQQADPFGNTGGAMTLADALVAAKPSIQQQIGDDPRLAWEVNKTLGDIFSSLSLFDEEATSYTAALEAARQLEGDNEDEVLVAIAGLGNALVRDNPSEAINFFAKELPDAPATDASAQSWLSAKYAQVNALTRLRRYDDADIAISQMAATAERFGTDGARTRGRLSQLLAGRAARADDLTSADQHWRDAVAHMRDADNPFALAVILSNQGIYLGRDGRYAEADEVFRDSLTVFEAYSPDDATHASVLRTYAGLLIRMGHQDAAIERLYEALSILGSLNENYTRYVVLVNLATFTLVAGRIDESLPVAIDGMRLALKEFGADSSMTQRMLAVYARLILFGGRNDEAMSLLTYATRTDIADDSQNLALADAAIDIGAVAIANASIERLTQPDTAASQQVRLRHRCAFGEPAMLRNLLDDIGASGDTTSNSAKHRHIWAAMSDAALVVSNQDSIASKVDGSVTAYRKSQHVFMDALDHWRALGALEVLSIAAGVAMPIDLQERLTSLRQLKIETTQLLETRYADEITILQSSFPPFADVEESADQLGEPTFCEAILP